MGFNWTPQAETRLAELASQGLPTRVIAEVLEITRNAVIGKAHRLGLDLKFQKAAAPRKERKRTGGLTFRANRKIPSRRVLDPVPAPDSRNLTLAELQKNDCRYIVTADSPFFFCGAPTIEDSSWCAHHHGVCHE